MVRNKHVRGRYWIVVLVLSWVERPCVPLPRQNVLYEDVRGREGSKTAYGRILSCGSIINVYQSDGCWSTWRRSWWCGEATIPDTRCGMWPRRRSYRTAAARKSGSCELPARTKASEPTRSLVPLRHDRLLGGHSQALAEPVRWGWVRAAHLTGSTAGHRELLYRHRSVSAAEF